MPPLLLNQLKKNEIDFNTWPKVFEIGEVFIEPKPTRIQDILLVVKRQ